MNKNYLCYTCKHCNGFFDFEDWPYIKVECTAKFNIRYIFPREKKCLQYDHKEKIL